MNKAKYYLNHSLVTLLPTKLLRWQAKQMLSHASQQEKDAIQQRIDYYNKVSHPFTLDRTKSTNVKSFHKTGGTTYYFDLYKVVKCFADHLRFSYINGDVVDVPSQPSFVKSRPIAGDNQNAVLLKLNAIRHYRFVDDKLAFKDKRDLLVWRGSGFRPNRRLLLDTLFGHPQCDIGRTDTKKGEQPEFVVPKMSIEEQLKYKFILSLEGKDVATNLKWIMSSNSLCITPKLRYETWFMEGKLEAGVHYVEVKDDFSDLIEKMNYYLEHQDEALDIIANANAWVAQFKNEKREKLIALKVAKKYFTLAE
ncbi:Glycosyl transferase family 90 [Vibrio xiamenensis]|uniref:Glycosyl transferase family 90 n=1 Tax=Vibrio xiamenensis TaxID=861298 RepID=A0A1G8EZ93_9VIBR|nr:glycosyl transferase family 90 [Vibrio xiamenensis]SDH75144.1 Glycosyl transferase family 90 [Vibrio xiamenensis]